jgi:hypothetical protein
MRELIVLLGALRIAAAFLTGRPEHTIADYLGYIDPPVKSIDDNLRGGLLGCGVPEAYIQPWLTTFNAIRSESPKTSETLIFLSCLERTHLDWSLLEGLHQSTRELNNHLRKLLGYAFITSYDTNPLSKKRYKMPNLIQAAIHEWLTRAGESHKQHCNALLVLYRKFEDIQTKSKNDIEAYTQQRHLLQRVDHFEKCCRVEKPVGHIYEITPALVCFAGLYAEDGRYQSASLFLEMVRDHYKFDDIWSAKARRDLAEIIRRFPSRGRDRSHELKQARDLLKSARATAQNIKDQKAEYEAVQLLALNYRDAGVWKLAAKNQNDVLKYMEGAHKDEPTSLELLNAKLRQSQIFFYRGRAKCSHDYLNDAKTIQDEILQTQLKAETYDIHYKAFLHDVKASLSRTRFALGNYLLAEGLARQVYNGRQQLFGDWDLKTMRIAQDLALCLLKLNRIEEAKGLLEDTKRRLSDKLGSKHLLVHKCEENLEAVRVKEEEKRSEAEVEHEVELEAPSMD